MVALPALLRASAFLLPCLLLPCPAQTWALVPAPRLELPVRPDGNSPSFWAGGALHLFTSTGAPEMLSIAPNQFGPWESEPVDLSAFDHAPLWIEAAYRDRDGVLFGWYHHEPGGVCGSQPLTAPKIGAVVSFDRGHTIQDLGIILESAYPPDCASRNGYFAGGLGDFSVILDRERKFFYFFFTNYSGPDEEQGIAVARLPYEDRFQPSGAVRKFYLNAWDEPGLGGRTTAVFAARVNWQRQDTDSFWGPAVHWNTYLRRYVMLLNRSCCTPGWPQEGIYISTNSSSLDPTRWPAPVKLLDHREIGFGPGFYPQVMGLKYGETDTTAGQRARLYIHGISDWEIHFFRNPLPSGSADFHPPGDSTGP